MQPDLARLSEVHAIATAAPDVIVSWFWTKQIPSSILTIAPGFGVHPSLLPRHRGPDPYFWTIDSDDEMAGVSAHVLAAEYDTGGLLGQRSIRVERDWSAWTLARKLDTPSLALLREVAGAYASGKPPTPQAQDERFVTLAPTPTEDDLELNWHLSAVALARRIRAASPYPGAFGFFGDQVVTVVRAEPTHRFPAVLAVGEATVVDGYAVVRCGDGALRLLEGRIDEGEREVRLSALELAGLISSMTAAAPIA
jgi:methionyl-tRNA formyltransferase